MKNGLVDLAYENGFTSEISLLNAPNLKVNMAYLLFSLIFNNFMSY